MSIIDIIISVIVIAALIYAYKSTRTARRDDCPYDCCCTCKECLTKCEKWAKEHKDDIKA